MNVHVHASDFSVTGSVSAGIAWRIAGATKHARGTLAHALVRPEADPSRALAEVQTEHHLPIDRAFQRVPLRRLARHDFAGGKP